MNIIKEVEKFAIGYFEEHVSSLLLYHSIEHTRFVAEMAAKMAETEKLDERDTNIVITAAWLHDIGHGVSIENHEEESCNIARELLSKMGADDEFIAEVEKCICSTRPDTEKNNIKEKILYDADHAHTGKENFMDISNLYRKELNNFKDKSSSKLEYWKVTLEFITNVTFFTRYAKENLEEVRKQNIGNVEKRIEKLTTGKLQQGKKETKKSTARGIETMFRLTARNQINLSSIADNKANIMLTINAILVSVLMSTSAITFRFEEQNFLFPGLVLIVGCLISLVFAILSVRPKYGSGNYSDEDLKNRKINLLFFGNIYKMPFRKYQSGIKDMMDDYDYLYGTLTKDQYNLGKVLAKKYKLLSYSYNFFMFSFVAAVLTFIIFYIIKM